MLGLWHWYLNLHVCYTYSSCFSVQVSTFENGLIVNIVYDWQKKEQQNKFVSDMFFIVCNMYSLISFCIS